MKSFFLITLFIITTDVLTAQVIPDPLTTYNKYLVERWSGEYMQISQYKVKGSPYFLGKAFPGILKFKDGSTKNNVRIIYDIYNEKAGIEQDSVFMELDKEISEYSIMLSDEYGGKTLVFRNAAEFGDPKKKGFYNVIGESGRYVFVREYKLRLIPDPVNSMARDFKMFEPYYEHNLYDSVTHDMKKVKLNKKSISSFFKDQAAVDAAIKADNLDLTSEYGVVLLMRKID